MPKIGLKHICTGKYGVTGSTATYTAGAILGKAIKANISINSNDVKLYAEDDVAESDTSFKDGKISIGVDDIPYTQHVALLGHALDETSSELVANEGDIAPYVGVGFYGKTKKNNVAGWRAVFLTKVQFSEPADETETKGETVSFQTPTIEGNILKDINGDWKREKTFTTEEEAITWLNSKVGITTQS